MTITKAAACLLVLFGTAATAAVLTDTEEAASNAGQVAVKRAQPVRVSVGGGSRLGVSIREVEEEDVKASRLSSLSGAIVEDVSEGSAAEKGGLRKGDVVVEFDGERVRSVRQLTRLVQETAPGRQVPVVVVREGQRTSLTVTPEAGGGLIEDFGDLAEWGRNLRFETPRVVPPAAPVPRGRTTPPSVFRFDELLGRGSSRLGLTVNDLSPQLAEYFGTKDGVLVTSVQDDSVAAKAGVKAGDVITSLNGSPVNDPAELRRRLQSLDAGAEFTISVVRDKKTQTLKGKLEQTTRRRTARSIV